MKVFEFSLIVIFLSACFASDVHAQEDGLWKTLIKKRADGKSTEIIAEKVTSQLDVPYINDGDRQHRLDIYSPAAKNKPLTILVHIHGGGWSIGDKRMMKSTGMFYASKGILFITPNYRLSPKVMHPAHVEDCAAALAWAFSHANKLGGDKNRIFLSGHSAGAHLAALLATNWTYLQKYNINPGDLAGAIPVDTASFDLLSNNHEKLVKRFIKQAFGSDQQVLKEASPFYKVTGKTGYPEFLILNTTTRESAAKAGEEFTDKLKNAGGDAEFIPVDNHTHKEMAMGMYNASDPVGSAILDFIFNEANE